MENKKFFASSQKSSAYKDVERSSIFNKTASNSMMQTLEEERIFRAPNKWEVMHVHDRWKSGLGSIRVGPPSRKLRRMHTRNILFAFFDNLLFLPIHLFEQSRHEPKRAATIAALVVLFLVVAGSSAQQFDSHSKYSSQLKRSVLQSVNYLKHYFPHCC